MKEIDIFNESDYTEDDINKKYPEKKEIVESKYKKKICYLVIILMVLIFLFIILKSKNITQLGGSPVAAIALSKGVSMDSLGIKSGVENMNSMNNGFNAQSSGQSSKKSKFKSPIGSTFNMVTSVLGKFFKLLGLIILIILIPTLPILLYCIIAYFVIKKFLFMISVN